MHSAIVGFIFGIAWLYQQSTLPNKAVLSGIAILSFFFLCLSFFPQFTRRLPLAAPVSRAIAGFAFGIVWASILAFQVLNQNLPEAMENRDMVLTGTVTSLPQLSEDGVRFRFAVEKAVYENRPVTIPDKIMLSWNNGHAPFVGKQARNVLPGQKWQFNVRLKRPHGNANPGGFDYELWLFEQGIRATGYVSNDARLPYRNDLIEPFVFSPANMIDLIRYRLRDRIYRALPECEYAGVIVALVIGDQNAISQSDWEVFNRTGISHLVAISGLHITLVSGLFAGLASALWRRSFFTKRQLPLLLPAQKAAAVAGAFMALVYVALAGFGIPARRTLCMIAIVALALWRRQLTRFSHILLSAAGIVLFFDPVALMKPGFWLSFGAVACILYATAGRTQRIDEKATGFVRLRHNFASAARTQWAVTVGLVPLTMLFFGRISVIGPVANAIAIPVVSLFVTPLALLGSILPSPLTGMVLKPVHAVVRLLAVFFEWLGTFPFAVWSAPAPSFYLIVFAMAGTLWMLAPKGWPLRYVGALCWFPLFLSVPTHPGYGEAHINVFDVGQGSAVFIETQKHRLLFDTGPLYLPKSDAADRTILPYLQSRGIGKLDAIIVSHGDNDHSGGLLTLTREIPVSEIHSSMPPDSLLVRVLPKHRPCLAGQRWEWEGIRFEILYPDSDDYLDKPNKTNNLSCVLKVSNAKYSLLLTGDIESGEERELVSRHGNELQSDILIVPHHGSKTSSSWPFLFSVKPRIAVFQAGYLNRYRHPHVQVTDRYDLIETTSYRTDRDGAILFWMGDTLEEKNYRTIRKRFWHTPRNAGRISGNAP